MKARLATLTSACVLLTFSACSAQELEKNPYHTGPLVRTSDELTILSGLSGTYSVVDARRSSDVATPFALGMKNPIGQTLTFTRKGIEMEGLSCEDWRIVSADDPVLFIDSDPNLVDLTLGPTDSPISSGDQREHQGFTVMCEGEIFLHLHKVDDRVLVMPWANSTINLILEKPLTEVQVKAYQAQLKSMKFYDGILTGELDADTLRASRTWYEYRARLDETQPIPGRPAITENLLDALRIQ